MKKVALCVFSVIGSTQGAAGKAEIERINYLATQAQNHRVDEKLKKQLDSIFDTESVKTALQHMYEPSFKNVPEAVQLNDVQRRLYPTGFSLVKNNLPIWSHRDIAGYVFKFPKTFLRPWQGTPYDFERANMQRIINAERIHKVAQEHDLPIRVPRKWAYFMPGGDGVTMPRIIVVAEKIFTGSDNKRKLSEVQTAALKTLMSHVPDLDIELSHPLANGNVVAHEHDLVILDTEPLGLVDTAAQSHVGA